MIYYNSILYFYHIFFLAKNKVLHKVSYLSIGFASAIPQLWQIYVCPSFSNFLRQVLQELYAHSFAFSTHTMVAYTKHSPPCKMLIFGSKLLTEIYSMLYRCCMHQDKGFYGGPFIPNTIHVFLLEQLLQDVHTNNYYFGMGLFDAAL